MFFKKKANPRICLIIGHDQHKMGARGCHFVYEYAYWSRVLNQFRDWENVFVLSRNDGGIKGAYNKADEILADVIIECHFNAFNGTIKGYQTLYYWDESIELAKLIQLTMQRTISFCNRGVKQIVNGDRGARNLSYHRKSVIIEPFFGDNPDDYIEEISMTPIMEQIIEKVREAYRK